MSGVTKFERKVFRVDVYGETIDLTPPTFKQMMVFEKKVKTAPEDADIIFDFLEERGLNREIAEEMYPEDLMKVIGIFQRKKK